MQLVLLIVSAIVAYLLGAIPSGLVVARVYRNVDITQVGSQKTGATNVLRTLGPGAAAIVFISDALKGCLAVLIASLLTSQDSLTMSIAALTAIVGHSYSVFIGFRGGRGVTPALGALLVMSPLASLIAVVIGACMIAATRYVSLGSMVGAASGGIAISLMALLGQQPKAYMLFGIVAAAFIIVSHRDNIARIASRTERRLGEKAEPA